MSSGHKKAKTFDQTLAIGIEVKNVQYILASLEYPTIKLKHNEEKIPRGMNFILKVSLHDNLGNEFSHNVEDVNGLKYDLSHKDIVDVQIGHNLTVAVSKPNLKFVFDLLDYVVCSNVRSHTYYSGTFHRRI